MYVVWAAKDLCLYVGMSTRGLSRPTTNTVLQEHARRIASLEILVCRDAHEAKRLEAEKIRDLRPELNRYVPKGASVGTPKQIAIYPDPELRKKIEAEAGARRRKLGPTVLEILMEYFATKKTKAA